MEIFQQALSEMIARILRRAPLDIARKLPSWAGRGAKAYARWLWHLDTVMKLVMLAVNVVILQIVAAKLPGPRDSYEQLVRLGAVGLTFFCFASILFGRQRG